MNQELQNFRYKIISPTKKMKQILVTLLCLNFVDSHPQYLSQIGCFWNTNNTFLVHAQIFGKFIQRKPNTINRNFRSHGFKYQKSYSSLNSKIELKYNFKNIPDPKNWFQRQCHGFNKNTTENQAFYWEFHELIPKKKRKVANNDEKIMTDHYDVGVEVIDERENMKKSDSNDKNHFDSYESQNSDEIDNYFFFNESGYFEEDENEN